MIKCYQKENNVKAVQEILTPNHTKNTSNIARNHSKKEKNFKAKNRE